MTQLEVTEIPRSEYGESAANWLTATRTQVQPKTTNRRLTSLKAFAKWAKWGLIEELEDYSAPTALKGQPHPIPEGIEGIKTMIETAKTPRHKSLVALCGLLGLRIGEALMVRPSHFNFDNMQLTVRGKGDKTRIVPVSTYAWSILASPVTTAFCDNDRLVIGLKDRFARDIIKKLGERSNLRREISSHDLRATFATEVYNKTLDIRLVQYLLGHADSSTTEIYVGRTVEQLKAGVEIG